MVQAKQGDLVKVHYTGKLDDGTVFDSSEGRDPSEFTVRSGQLIPGFDSGVIGMNVGESKTVQIPSADAYGPHQDEMVLAVERSTVPEDIELQEGMQLQITGPDNQALVVTVAAITEDTVQLDANHPLAGKDLIFDLTLVDIE